jgi:membrane protease YdiL (CAAX protease family)
MHADLPGGVGIVRIVASTCLGLTCGMARQITGAIWAPMLLHFANNLIAIGSMRRWFGAGASTILDGVPDALLLAAVAGSIAAGAFFFARRSLLSSNIRRGLDAGRSAEAALGGEPRIESEETP